MTDEHGLPLTGKEERVIRVVERTLASEKRREQPGVKITNLASGKVQVEVHAYDDDLTAAGDRARAEFDRQLGLESVPVAELERMRWLATIGQATLERQTDLQAAADLEDSVEPDPALKEMLAKRDDFLAEVEAVEAGKPHDIPAGPGHRVRKSVPAVGDESDDLLAKLRAVTEDHDA